MMIPWINDYIASHRRALESIDAAILSRMIDTLREAWHEDRQIFACGNGGSAANASHFVTDLGKGSSDAISRAGGARRFRVLSLCDCTSWITALGNDYAYEDIFVRQLENYGRQGDILIGASVSGDSPNLVKAFAWAKEHGLRTLALVGEKRGAMVGIAEQVLVIDDTHYGRVEDAQMHAFHMMCYAFIEQPEVATGNFKT